MRTIRIKLFKFDELSSPAKQTAIKYYREYVLRQYDGSFNSPDRAIIQIFERRNYEFTREGNHFITPPKITVSNERG